MSLHVHLGNWCFVLCLSALSGNCLGEEGCEALKETLENMDKADLLASLRCVTGCEGLTVHLVTLV